MIPPSTSPSPLPLALVTTSFRRDLDRCRLLCASVDRFVDAAIPHYLLIDARDVPLFDPLRSNRRRIIAVERMLPWWLRRVPRSKRWWFSFRTLPVRNWILQQLVKLSVVDHVDADAYVFVDSDVTFVRPFAAGDVVRADGSVRLFRVPESGQQPRHLNWHAAAARLLGLPPRRYFGSDYIGNLITWRRDVLRQLHARLAGGRWGGWRPRLCNTLDFSEYILYGVFTEFVLGQAAGHWFDADDLCHCSWHYTLETQPQIDAFVDKLRPRHVAVLIQSNLDWTAARHAETVAAVECRAAELAESASGAADARSSEGRLATA
jgi:hypothetical protein